MFNVIYTVHQIIASNKIKFGVKFICIKFKIKFEVNFFLLEKLNPYNPSSCIPLLSGELKNTLHFYIIIY